MRIRLDIALPALLLSLASACSAAGAGSKVESIRSSSPARDGTPIAWVKRGSGAPAIVLIHCWCGNRSFWKYQIDELAREHEVVMLDLPGHGESGRDRATWSVEGFGADVAKLCGELGLERVILVGHSMGGPVALAAAARMPGKVAGIVAVDTLHDATLGMTKEQVEPFVAQFERDFAAGMHQAVPSMLPPDADPDLTEWIIEEALRTDPRAAVALMRSFPDLDMPALLRGAKAPIRAINSADSPWPTNIEANRRFADFDATVMPGVGHYPHLENPKEFNAHLERWIDALSR
jgi:pimeloyl-ACP methyl ester carboxylesterase